MRRAMTLVLVACGSARVASPPALQPPAPAELATSPQEPDAIARQASRLASAANAADRADAVRAVMTAVLHAALTSADRAAQVDAIAAANQIWSFRYYSTHREVADPQLIADVGELTAATDPDTAVAAVEALVWGHDPAVVDRVVAQLPGDLIARPTVATAEASLLATVPARTDDIVRAAFAASAGTPSAALIALFPDVSPSQGETGATLARWFAAGTPATRRAVCAAVPAAILRTATGKDLGVAAPLLDRGFRDADPSVRAACAETLTPIGGWLVSEHEPHVPAVAAQIRELAHGVDGAVRAAAIEALAELDCDHPPRAASDPVTAVRVAYARAVEHAPSADTAIDLCTLARDVDPGVRAAALQTLLERKVTCGLRHNAFVARAGADASAAVRLVIIGELDEPALDVLATRDPAPEVRTAALVRLAHRRGRAAMTKLLLDKLAASPPQGRERIGIALAWLRAR